MWAMASPLLCSELRPIIQRRVEVIFHQETKGAVPPNHAIPLCISNDGLQRQIDEDGRVEAVYRHFKPNRVLWAAERLFSLEETLYKPQWRFRNLDSSKFHQTAWLWRIVTARKPPGFWQDGWVETSVGSGGTENFPNVFSYLAYGSGDVIAHQISSIDQELDLVGYRCAVTQQETPRVFSDQLCGWNHRFRLSLGVES